MAYIPDVRGRSEEGAQKHEYRLEDLERAEQKARHVRAVGSRSRRWMWALLIVALVVAALFLLYQVAVPADPFPPFP